MKWNHLPVAGGWYDQHPQLVDEWMILFRLDNEHEKQRQDKEMAEIRNRSKPKHR